jgi:competence protein CoiA
MKYALVDGSRREAEPRLSGACPGCGFKMVAKCGERRAWHWAHRGVQHCDRWWESETEWHRGWKNRFPAECQEVMHWAEDGEKHIADVKTRHGRVIEFQHSYLKPEERRAREAFYKRMVWVVDGLTRKRDKQSFYKALGAGRLISVTPLAYSVPSNGCSLLRDWASSHVDVFFDLGETLEAFPLFRARVLWRLYPKSPDGLALLSPVPVVNFIQACLGGAPLKGIYAKAVVEPPSCPPPSRPVRRSRRATGFEQYLARKHRARSRRRI